MKKCFLLMLAYAAVVFVCDAQMAMLSDAALPGKPLMVSKDVKYSGSPYLFTDWVSAKITLKNESKYENVRIRYDVLGDIIEYEREGAVFLLEPATAKEFSFKKYSENEEYLFKNGFVVPNYSKTNYFEVISEGKVKVLKKHTKQIVNDPSATYGSSLSQTLQDQDFLFAILPDNSTQSFKATKKSVVGLFPDKQKEIEAYIKKESLNLKEKSDLKLVFQYIDSIL